MITRERVDEIEQQWAKHPVIVQLNLPDNIIQREEILMFKIIQLQHRVEAFARDNMLQDERAYLLRKRLDNFEALTPHSYYKGLWEEILEDLMRKDMTIGKMRTRYQVGLDNA